jgi:hypothetical protein
VKTSKRGQLFENLAPFHTVPHEQSAPVFELKKEERKRKRDRTTLASTQTLQGNPRNVCFVLGANKNESFVRSCSWGLLCERLCHDHVYVVHVYVVTVICSSPTSLGVWPCLFSDSHHSHRCSTYLFCARLEYWTLVLKLLLFVSHNTDTFSPPSP